jgi:hypothetical protein
MPVLPATKRHKWRITDQTILDKKGETLSIHKEQERHTGSNVEYLPSKWE